MISVTERLIFIKFDKGKMMAAVVVRFSLLV